MAACFGSSVREERREIEDAIEKLVEQPLLLGGDFNGITRKEETTCMSRDQLMWEWFREKEDQGKLVDCVKVGYKGPPPFTRVRGYKGTKSYLDKWYASDVMMALMQITQAWVAPVKNDAGEDFSDHDRAGISLGKWCQGQVEIEKGYKEWAKK